MQFVNLIRNLAWNDKTSRFGGVKFHEFWDFLFVQSFKRGGSEGSVDTMCFAQLKQNNFKNVLENLKVKDSLHLFILLNLGELSHAGRWGMDYIGGYLPLI